jgi:hypothetical protein
VLHFFCTFIVYSTKCVDISVRNRFLQTAVRIIVTLRQLVCATAVASHYWHHPVYSLFGGVEMGWCWVNGEPYGRQHLKRHHGHCRLCIEGPCFHFWARSEILLWFSILSCIIPTYFHRFTCKCEISECFNLSYLSCIRFPNSIFNCQRICVVDIVHSSTQVTNSLAPISLTPKTVRHNKCGCVFRKGIWGIKSVFCYPSQLLFEAFLAPIITSTVYIYRVTLEMNKEECV